MSEENEQLLEAVKLLTDRIDALTNAKKEEPKKKDSLSTKITPEDVKKWAADRDKKKQPGPEFNLTEEDIKKWAEKSSKKY